MSDGIVKALRTRLDGLPELNAMFRERLVNYLINPAAGVGRAAPGRQQNFSKAEHLLIMTVICHAILHLCIIPSFGACPVPRGQRRAQDEARAQITRASLRILVLHQLLGALGGADHSLDQGDAQAAFLKLKQPIDGTARRGGDHILQLGRMLSRVQDQGGSAQ